MRWRISALLFARRQLCGPRPSISSPRPRPIQIQQTIERGGCGRRRTRASTGIGCVTELGAMRIARAHRVRPLSARRPAVHLAVVVVRLTECWCRPSTPLKGLTLVHLSSHRKHFLLTISVMSCFKYGSG